MACRTNFSLRESRLKFTQKGAVLIFMAFILGLGAAAYLLKTFNSENVKTKQSIKTAKTLKEAKIALIAWAVNHTNTPGLMPYPDRNGDGNYDDTSDCYAPNINFASYFTLGRLPLFKSDPNCVNAKNNVNSGLADDFRDGTGERLWYEVSRNLLHDYKSTVPNPDGVSPIINPSIVNTPIYPWFVVRDRNGTIISNRVAAVIIAPGAPSGAQDHSGGIANANQYLDKIVMADGTPYQNYGYQDAATNPTQEFIVGDDFKVVAKNDPTYKNQAIEPYYYNDKLVYITIDELMAALEKRAAAEMRAGLNKYYASTGFYPYAAGLNLATNAHQCVKGNLQGFLPITTASNYTCSCTNTKNCNCHFAGINSIKYTRVSGVYGSSGAALPTGSCSVENSNQTCACSGAGSCKSSSGLTTQFSCDACGACSSSPTVNGSFSFLAKGNFSASTAGCIGNGGSVGCTGSVAGTFAVDACTDAEFNSAYALPAWFTANNWQDYIYYEVSPNCTSANHASCTTATPQIKVGEKQGIRSLLITTGRTIIATPFAVKNSAQIQPSCALGDYLDSTENINSDAVYDALNTPRNLRFNDQMFVVAP